MAFLIPGLENPDWRFGSLIDASSAAGKAIFRPSHRILLRCARAMHPPKGGYAAEGFGAGSPEIALSFLMFAQFFPLAWLRKASEPYSFETEALNPQTKPVLFKVSFIEIILRSPKMVGSSREALKPEEAGKRQLASLLDIRVLPLVSREWKIGSNSSYNCTPFLHSLLTNLVAEWRHFTLFGIILPTKN